MTREEWVIKSYHNLRVFPASNGETECKPFEHTDYFPEIMEINEVIRKARSQVTHELIHSISRLDDDTEDTFWTDERMKFIQAIYFLHGFYIEVLKKGKLKDYMNRPSDNISVLLKITRL